MVDSVNFLDLEGRKWTFSDGRAEWDSFGDPRIDRDWQEGPLFAGLPLAFVDTGTGRRMVVYEDRVMEFISAPLPIEFTIRPLFCRRMAQIPNAQAA